MNLEEEKLKIQQCISGLKAAAIEAMLLERSEAYKYGAKILEDYLKYLNRRDGIS